MDRAVAQREGGEGVAPGFGDVTATGETGAGPASRSAGRPEQPARRSSAQPSARLSMQLTADPAVLRAMRRRVQRWADGHGASEEDLTDLQLALGEAVSNGMEHAYPADARGPVEVDLEFRPAAGERLRAVAVRVRDHGRWRPAPASSGSRGRGLAMIEALSAEMRVTSNTRGTEVTFTVALP